MRRKGFTLIEVLIVTAIIIVITAFSLASYRDFNETRKLQEVAKQVAEVLELTKKGAFSGNYASSLNLTCTSRISQFSWQWVGPPTSRYVYITSIKCTNGMSNTFSILSSTFLPQGFVFSTNFGFVEFKSFGGGTNSNSTITITVRNTTTNKTKNITVDRVGNINIP